MNLSIENILNDSQSTIFLLHNIGKTNSTKRAVRKNYTLPERIKKSKGLFTFDGVYKNVYENIKYLDEKPVILFIIGNWAGGDNRLDKEMPREKMCSYSELAEISDKIDAEPGWHTWNHKDLTTLSIDEIIEECKPPFPMDYFAYPYGRFNKEVIAVVKALGYKYAFSVGSGDNSEYQKLRKYL